MTARTLIWRGLRYYWRTNLAVVAGAAIAVSVLAGAAMVGDSVRQSLRELVLSRLGNTSLVVTGPGFFREALGAELDPAACPMIQLESVVSRGGGERTRAGVALYGVDDRFWRFHQLGDKPPSGREAFLSPALARELGVDTGGSLLVRVRKPSAIPAESLHGRKDQPGQALRVRVARIQPAAQLGEFSLRPGQGEVRTVFLPLRRLQQDLDLGSQVNTILLRAGSREEIGAKLDSRVALADLGLRLRPLPEAEAFAIESAAGIMTDSLAESARSAASAQGLKTSPVLTYLANTIRVGTREIPYSLITATEGFGEGITLTDWAASDLGAKPGDTVHMDYYVWREDGELVTQSAEFPVNGIVPLNGIPAARNLAPEYPGLTDSPTLHDWDPPFPIDLKRVRPKDEEFWKAYRTTPKAYLSLSNGRKLWQSRFGSTTSIRVSPLQAQDQFASRWREEIDPLSEGFLVTPVREQGLQASRGATDFGEYFLYFSFFLVLSALLLVGMFFKLGVEQRLREIGLFRAIGFSPARIRTLFLGEGAILAVAGALIGAAGAVLYADLVLLGLRTWWVDAVGTQLIRLHVSPSALGGGVAGGVITAILCIWWSLRALRHATPRALLTGHLGTAAKPDLRRRRLRFAAFACLAGAVALVVLAALGSMDESGGFFGGGALLLASILCFLRLWLDAPRQSTVSHPAALGMRNAAWKPGRSLLSIALIAFATFIIVSVEAFRREGGPPPADPHSGTGGYSLFAESILPVVFDLNTAAGRDSLALPSDPLKDARFVSFRLKPGEDASCLNLYEPRNPRVIAPPDRFLEAGRFAFQSSMAETPDEKANPWLLLRKTQSDGSIPAIADANSLTYVLHRKVGDVFVLDRGGTPVKFRFVGALSDSIFQRELVISEQAFVNAFPHDQGFRFFLIEAPQGRSAEVSQILEDTLSDFGFDTTPAGEYLAGFHRVENTYLSTFQMLGALGLMLGTLGLAAILLRNVLEARRELALLRAVGFRRSVLSRIVLAENLLLLVAGLATGFIAAAIAILPALAERGWGAPILSFGILLGVVFVTGMAASLLAIAAITRAPLLPALRSE